MPVAFLDTSSCRQCRRAVEGKGEKVEWSPVDAEGKDKSSVTRTQANAGRDVFVVSRTKREMNRKRWTFFKIRSYSLVPEKLFVRRLALSVATSRS